MSQAEEFCKELMVMSRKNMTALARRFKAQRSDTCVGPRFIFPDGSSVQRRDSVIEAYIVTIKKYWVGGCL